MAAITRSFHARSFAWPGAFRPPFLSRVKACTASHGTTSMSAVAGGAWD
jgi:hypothetical protein